MDDAVILPCGHSFGGGGIQHVIRMVGSKPSNAIIFSWPFLWLSHLKNVIKYGAGNFQLLFLIYMPPHSRMAGVSTCSDYIVNKHFFANIIQLSHRNKPIYLVFMHPTLI